MQGGSRVPSPPAGGGPSGSRVSVPSTANGGHPEPGASASEVPNFTATASIPVSSGSWGIADTPS